jgi:glutamyl-tRNA reductase
LSVRPNLSFHLVGVSHHTAAVQVRERYAFSPDEAAAILELLRQHGMSAVLVSTCNRCELYWSGPQDGEAWFQRLGRSSHPDEGLVLNRQRGMSAVRHLFRVTAGLDSQILGETEVLGQVRRAYDAARAAGTTTSEMDLIFSAALAAGRKIRRETLLGRHPASVSSAAVELVLNGWKGPQAPVISLLGAGEAAEGVLRALNQQGASGVRLLSRHPERADALARAWGASVAGLAGLETALLSSDVLIVATSSTRPVVGAAQLAQAARAREGRELLVVDLAVPRNVEPAARGIEGIRLLDLDDLQRLCCPAAGKPAEALADAEAVLEDELIRLGLNLRGRLVAPRLSELHQISREMAEQESQWALDQLDGLTPAEREVVRKMADRLVRRVLYPLSRNLRAESQAEILD